MFSAANDPMPDSPSDLTPDPDPTPDPHLDGSAADASVRPARPSDLPAVGRLQSQVWRSAYASVVPGEVLARLEPSSFTRAWRDSLAAPPSHEHHLLVALAGAQVVGMAAVGPSGDPDASTTTGELLVLAVHPDARRAGHGSRLLNAATVTLLDSGMAQVRAWVLSDHDDTRAFLGAAGLEPDGARRTRLVDDQGGTVQETRLSAGLSPESAEPTAAEAGAGAEEASAADTPAAPSAPPPGT